MQFLPMRSTSKIIAEKSEQKPRENRKLIVGGLVGFTGVCVVQLLGIGHLDLSLKIAVSLFALSIPILVRDILDVQGEDRHGVSINLNKRLDATTTGITGSIAGIAAIFWHFSPWLCSLFLVSCFWCAWSHSSYLDDLSEEAQHQAKDYPKGAEG